MLAVNIGMKIQKSDLAHFSAELKSDSRYVWYILINEMINYWPQEGSKGSGPAPFSREKFYHFFPAPFQWGMGWVFLSNFPAFTP